MPWRLCGEIHSRPAGDATFLTMTSREFLATRMGAILAIAVVGMLRAG